MLWISESTNSGFLVLCIHEHKGVTLKGHYSLHVCRKTDVYLRRRLVAATTKGFIFQIIASLTRSGGYARLVLTGIEDGILSNKYRMLLKRGTGSGERGAGSGERGTEVWERVVSGNLHKNPKWRSKKRDRERRRQRKEFVPWLKSGGDEIANQTHILRLRFEQVVCFFDIQPVSFTI